MPESTVALSTPTLRSRYEPAKSVPGEVGIWVFILGDMALFGAFFGVFVYDRSTRVATFAWSQAELHLSFGAINTCLLLTGSLFVVWAVQAAGRGANFVARRFIALAMICGSIFLIDKVIEYSEKLSHGFTPNTNLYFTYYYMFTGIHAIHLIIGLITLGHIRKLLRKPELSAVNYRTINVVACYWHLVDLLWVVLFALLYLMA
ncbi:heme-copper oxidase subunit III [Nocardia sp. NPDC059246]|uniref:cytochrome c oxidase subunit 3 n=1 Tax=unclassified Nocardia TaxID=2637762 RepID=UPI0036C17FDE